MQSIYLMLGAAVLWAQLVPASAHAAGHDAPPPQSGAPAPAAQESAAPLTLDQAIDLALSASPALRAVAYKLAIAQGAGLQAAASPNPELSVLREGIQASGRTQTIQLSQALELGGQRGARIALAGRDSELAQGDVDVARAELRADVTAAYLEALTAQERVGLARASLQLAGKASGAAGRRVAAGKISPLEQTRSTVAEAGARLELMQAMAQAASAARRLAGLWGGSAPPDRPLVMPDTDPGAIAPLEQLQARLEASPQWRRARLRAVRERAQLQLERTARMPDLTVTIGNKKDNELNRSQTVIGLSVPLPLFDRHQGRLLSAQRRVDQAEAETEVEQLRLREALADAYQRAQLAEQQISSMRADILPAAQNAVEAAVTGFELGKFGFLDVLDAQRTLFQSRALYLQGLSERYRALADLRRYTDYHATTDRNTR